MSKISENMASNDVTNLRLKNIEEALKGMSETLKYSYVTQDQHKLLIQRVEIAEANISAARRREMWYIFLIITESIGLVVAVARALFLKI